MGFQILYFYACLVRFQGYMFVFLSRESITDTHVCRYSMQVTLEYARQRGLGH